MPLEGELRCRNGRSHCVTVRVLHKQYEITARISVSLAARRVTMDEEMCFSSGLSIKDGFGWDMKKQPAMA